VISGRPFMLSGRQKFFEWNRSIGSSVRVFGGRISSVPGTVRNGIQHNQATHDR
jgi:hypothetical protein